jgi:putative membrane protein
MPFDMESTDRSNSLVDNDHTQAELPLKYLHPISLFFDLLAHARSYLLPIVFGLLGAANGNIGWLIVSAILFVPAVTSSVLRYFTLKYRIEDEHLFVDQGLFFRKTRTIPVDRIQNIDLTQNIFHRICRVAEVKIETASGSEAEATLRVLSLDQVEALRSTIFQNKSAQPSSVAAKHFDSLGTENSQSEIRHDDEPVLGDSTTNNQIATAHSGANDAKLVWQIPISDLAKAGLASNRGLVLVGVLFGVAYQFGEDSYQTIFETLSRILPENNGTASYYLTMASMAIIVLVLLRLMGIGWYILRFYGYTLTRRGDDLRIACGLFTKVSATVPRNRIQFISVQQNLIMRWLKIATIRIETAGGANDNSSPSESVAKSWFLPVIAVSKVPEIVGLLRTGLDWGENRFEYHGLSPRAASRYMRLAVIESALLAGVAGYFYWPWGLLAGVCVLPIFTWWAGKKASSRKYARTDDSVIYRSGIFTKKTSVTFFEKIQSVTCDQTPFDRRWQMATLSVDTAASKSCVRKSLPLSICFEHK